MPTSFFRKAFAIRYGTDTTHIHICVLDHIYQMEIIHLHKQYTLHYQNWYELNQEVIFRIIYKGRLVGVTHFPKPKPAAVLRR